MRSTHQSGAVIEKKLSCGSDNNTFVMPKFLWLVRNIAQLTLYLLVSYSVDAQHDLVGRVLDIDDKAIEGARVEIIELNRFEVTDTSGQFTFKDLPDRNYTLRFSSLGRETIIRELNIGGSDLVLDQPVVLKLDPLDLSGVIVTGNFNEASKLESSIAVSSLSSEEMRNRASKGTASLLQAVPGTFADASTGEVFTRVFSRGISISAEDDLGWFYVSLQEDGLPVTATQHTFYGPDFFHRIDHTVRRLEAVRGGSAAVLNNNSPGGIFNFISKVGDPLETEGEVLLSTIIYGKSRTQMRIDGNLGGPLSTNGWQYNLGGFYRHDEGARVVDINWNRGGQVKLNVVKATKSGYLKFYGKYLNDQVNRWTGVAAVDWDSPRATFGQDFGTTALMFPSLAGRIADGRRAADNPDASFEFNPDNGIRTRDFAMGADFSTAIGSGWVVRNNLKFSAKKADWQSSIGNQPLGLEQIIPYVLNGISADFSVLPIGQIVFREARNPNQILARVNNQGILGPFSGQPPSFEYLEGSLPNDALMGIAPWKKEDDVTEVMDQLTLQKRFNNHSLTTGIYFAYSDVETFTSGSFAYATYEPNPRMLKVTLENPGEPVVHLSDDYGLSNYGGLFYNHGSAKVRQSAIFINDVWKLNDQFTADAGLRFEFSHHEGSKDRFAPVSSDLDNRPETAYNNSTLVATGEADDFDFNYEYLSWSLGLNYRLSTSTGLFARVTSGHKAPELNYYFNNFSNLPIPEAGNTQDIFQIESGWKLYSENVSLFATAFWSRLDNVSFSEFVFDENTGTLFFTPAQLNQTTTYGLELESVFLPVRHWQIRLQATLQRPEASQFTVYDANGTADNTDDQIVDYSGNVLPHNPEIWFELSPGYQAEKFDAFFTWRFMGSRQANISNAFVLPSFSVFSTGLEIDPSPEWSLSLIVNNLFDGEGLMNFFGPNEFGSNSNEATPEYIAENPNGSFVVFPIVPRSINVGVKYRFL